MTSIRDVAEHAGVSPATVSRVLNGRNYVSDNVRRAVERSVEELGYRPNVHARQLRGIRSKLIGFITTESTHPYSADVEVAIEDVARKHDYSLLIANTHSDVRLFEHYVRTFIAFGIDGLIIAPPSTRKRLRASLEGSPIPYVLINDLVPGLAADQIVTDNLTGTYDLTTHLIRLGYRRIVFVGGNTRLSMGRDRLEGFRRALSDHGLPLDEGLIRMREFDEASGVDLTREILRDSQPDALLAANVDVLVGVLQAVRAAGLTIPNDIAVVGFGDLPYAEKIGPFVTVMAHQTRMIGLMATQLLLDKLSGNRALSEHQTVVLQPRLIIRESCGARRASR